MKKAKILTQISCMLLFGALKVIGSQDLELKIMILQEDIERLTQQNGALVLQMEAIEEENSKLKSKVTHNLLKQDQLIKNYNISTQNNKNQFDILQNKINKTSKEQKDKIVLEVTQNLENLLKKSNLESKPEHAHQFSDSYPKKGIAYIVKPGDTLSVIARNNHSTIQDIQNANYIRDPKNLRAGQTIFVPQKSKNN